MWVPNQDNPRLNPMGSQFDSFFMKFVFRITGGIKFWDLSEHSDKFQLSLGWNTYLPFKSDIVNFQWKTDEGAAESIVLLIFVLWQCFNCQWMRGRVFPTGWGGMRVWRGMGGESPPPTKNLLIPPPPTGKIPPPNFYSLPTKSQSPTLNKIF